MMVSLYLPVEIEVETYYKYGPTVADSHLHWYEFTYDPETGTGAQIDGNVIKLHFVDGARGDGDLTENGSIVDPGGPGILRTDNPETGNNENGGDGGGGGCFISSLKF